MFLKALNVGVLIISVACSLFFYTQNLSLSTQADQKVAEKTTEIKNLQDDMDGLEAKLSKQKELLDSRQGFIASVGKAKAALLQAGKVRDITKSWDLILAAQETVYQEKDSPQNVVVQQAAVDKETGKLLALVTGTNNVPEKSSLVVTAADLLEDLAGLHTLPANHPARQALNAVGGEDIKLGAAPVVCGRSDSLACSYPSGTILLADAYTNGDYDYYYPIMMHEYAHHFQFQYADALERSQKYKELFNSDKEWLADCMAASKIPGYMSNYRYQCSPEQKEYGAGAWKGIFP